jgi:uncharacterized protein (DUF488 family)
VAKNLHTIGYEGATLDRFLDALSRAGVRLVIDVRAVAVSRRRGFSKSALAAALAGADVAYVHIRDLGDPKPGREAARAGRMDEFRRVYRAHLRSDSARAALAEAAAAARERTACLLCYEAAPSDCHRTIVATAIAKGTGLAVQHLFTQCTGPEGQLGGGAGRQPRIRAGAGEGHPAAE